MSAVRAPDVGCVSPSVSRGAVDNTNTCCIRAHDTWVRAELLRSVKIRDTQKIWDPPKKNSMRTSSCNVLVILVRFGGEWIFFSSDFRKIAQKTELRENT